MMKIATYFWCGIAGLSSILLLGQLFADYEQLREGVMKLFGLIALGVFSVSGLNVLIACTNRTHRQPIAPVIIASLIASGIVLIILALVAAIGGGR